MSPGRPRLRHGTVVAYLALFLALAGGAIAAATIDSGDVVNGSLKSVDLKNRAGVKGIDVRNGALAGGDVRNGSLRGAQVADDSLGGADISEPTLAVSQLSASLGGPMGAALPLGVAIPVPNGAYAQAATENNVYIAGGKVTFSAACIQPRSAVAYLLLDGTALTTENLAGVAQVIDTDAGASTRSFSFGPAPGARGLSQARTGVPINHQFHVLASASCNSGAGITLDSLGIDVVGER